MFQPWKFFRNPPPTVPSPAIIPSESAAAAPSGSSPTNTSRATVLESKLQNLAGTANYLQSIILSLTKGLGVTVNANADPGLAQALSSVYGSIPPAISAQMYSNLLDVEFGAHQVLLAAGTDAGIQPNPFQNASAVTINKAVESALSDTGNFQSQSALMLRNLKTQQMVYTQWAQQLNSYPASQAVNTPPAANTIQASTIDVGDDVNGALNNHIDSMSSIYASVFNLFASASSISQDIMCMVNTIGALARTEQAQLKSLFDLVRKTDVSESMQDISNGLTSFVFGSMMCQASMMLFQLDRIGQMALNPLRSIQGPLGSSVGSVQNKTTSQLVGIVRATTIDARISSGPLGGLIASNTAASSCGQKQTTSPPPSPNCFASMRGGGNEELSVGMQDLSTLLDWSLQKASQKIDSALASLQKLMSRTQSDTCNQVKLLALVNNLETLSSLTAAFLAQQQSSSTRAGAASTSLLLTLGSILSATASGNKTTYTVQNGVVSVNPPTVPPPTSAAVAVLSQAGVQTQLAGIAA